MGDTNPQVSFISILIFFTSVYDCFSTIKTERVQANWLFNCFKIIEQYRFDLGGICYLGREFKPGKSAAAIDLKASCFFNTCKFFSLFLRRKEFDRGGLGIVLIITENCK